MTMLASFACESLHGVASPMAVTVELDVSNPSGIHARPAATFVKACLGFRSDIRVWNVTTASDGASAKSILSVLGLGVSKGHRVRLRIEGDDEAEAAATLQGMIESGLGEAQETG